MIYAFMLSSAAWWTLLPQHHSFPCLSSFSTINRLSGLAIFHQYFLYKVHQLCCFGELSYLSVNRGHGFPELRRGSLHRTCRWPCTCCEAVTAGFVTLAKKGRAGPPEAFFTLWAKKSDVSNAPARAFQLKYTCFNNVCTPVDKNKRSIARQGAPQTAKLCPREHTQTGKLLRSKFGVESRNNSSPITNPAGSARRAARRPSRRRWPLGHWGGRAEPPPAAPRRSRTHQMCRQLSTAKTIPNTRASGTASSRLSSLYSTYLLSSNSAWLQIHTLSKEWVSSGSAITSSKPSWKSEQPRRPSAAAARPRPRRPHRPARHLEVGVQPAGVPLQPVLRALLPFGQLGAARREVVVVHEDAGVRLLRLQPHGAARRCPAPALPRPPPPAPRPRRAGAERRGEARPRPAGPHRGLRRDRHPASAETAALRRARRGTGGAARAGFPPLSSSGVGGAQPALRWMGQEQPTVAPVSSVHL